MRTNKHNHFSISFIKYLANTFPIWGLGEELKILFISMQSIRNLSLHLSCLLDGINLPDKSSLLTALVLTICKFLVSSRQSRSLCDFSRRNSNTVETRRKRNGPSTWRRKRNSDRAMCLFLHPRPQSLLIGSYATSIPRPVPRRNAAAWTQG